MRQLAMAAWALFLLTAVGVVFADYQDGLDAYSDGHYQRAMMEWREVTDGPADAVLPPIYAEAHYAIAMLYWRGEGVARDYFEARKWLTRAADLGHVDAMAKIGFMYTDGLTVDQDHEEAIRWFRRAAQEGSVDGLYNLGIFYLYGWGTEPDRTLAKQYLASASALGDPAAEQAFQQLLAEEDTMQAAAKKAEAESVAAEWAEAEGAAAEVEVDGVMEAAPAGEEEPAVIAGESWILEQNPGHYTIQVMALDSEDSIRVQVEGFEYLAPFAIYTLPDGANTVFVLVQGNYDTVEAARAARDAFPSRLERPEKVWIRRFGMIQDRIREARAR